MVPVRKRFAPKAWQGSGRRSRPVARGGRLKTAQADVQAGPTSAPLRGVRAKLPRGASVHVRSVHVLAWDLSFGLEFESSRVKFTVSACNLNVLAWNVEFCGWN